MLRGCAMTRATSTHVALFFLSLVIASFSTHAAQPMAAAPGSWKVGAPIVKGALLGYFGPPGNSRVTHAVVVNLDYKNEATLGIRGPGRLEAFDATAGKWL